AGIAPRIELIHALELNSSVGEELGQATMDDRGAELRFDVVTDNRNLLSGELVGPLRIRDDERWHAVDEADAFVETRARIVFRGLLTADRQVAHHHIGLGRPEDLSNVDRRRRGRTKALLGGVLQHVLRETVENW